MKIFKPSSNNKIDFTPVDTYPEVSVLIERKNAVQVERRSLIDERAEILERLRTETDDTEAFRVEQILNGKPEVPTAPVSQRLGELNKRIRDLDQATDAFFSKIQTERNRASIKICEEVKQQHDDLARALAGKLSEAHTASLAYVGFLDRLADANVSTHHLPTATPFFLESKDPFGNTGRWFADALKSGVVGKSEIPTGLTQ